MPEIIEQILQALRPDTIGAIFIYTILLLSVLMTILTPDGNDMATNLQFAVIFFCVLDLLRGGVSFPIPGADDAGFFTFFLHVGMFVIPFIIAGTVRKKGRQGGAVLPVAVLTGVIALVYAAGAFFDPNTFYNNVLF